VVAWTALNSRGATNSHHAATHGEHVAGRISNPESVPGRLRAHVTSAGISAEWLGLFDVIGNVWEWTDDWYKEHQHATMSRVK
jgi:formylglycine-generating enzyme required for sulfatase activity